MVGGTIANGGNLLTVGGAGNTTISGAISGAGGLTRSGSGNLFLTSDNTYSGNTTINSGANLYANNPGPGQATGISNTTAVGNLRGDGLVGDVDVSGTGDILPGATVYLEVDVPAGEYGFMCFTPDMKDGKPHLAHGMIKQVSVK